LGEHHGRGGRNSPGPAATECWPGWRYQGGRNRGNAASKAFGETPGRPRAEPGGTPRQSGSGRENKRAINRYHRDQGTRHSPGHGPPASPVALGLRLLQEKAVGLLEEGSAASGSSPGLISRPFRPSIAWLITDQIRSRARRTTHPQASGAVHGGMTGVRAPGAASGSAGHRGLGPGPCLQL